MLITHLTTGCGKCVERFGLDAMKLVNARVVQAGTIRRGDIARTL